MRKSRTYGEKEASLNITSMMDAFTIVLVFLLKSFAAEGNLLTQADNLKLPYSVSQKQPTEVSLIVIVDADQIIVLGNGTIAEQGKHQQLLDLDGQYARLWQIQVNKQARE